MAKKTRLMEHFHRVAAGTFVAMGLSATALSSIATYEDYMAQPYNYNPNKPASWAKIVAHDSRPFDPAGVVKPTAHNGHIQLVQIEIDKHLISSLLLSLEEGVDGLLERHGEAAAMIAKNSADALAKDSVDTHYIGRMDERDWFCDVKNSYAKALYENADVVSFSMILFGNHPFSKNNMALLKQEDVDTADKFWQGNTSIVVRAVGNDGYEDSFPLPPYEANLFMRADTTFLVGAGGVDTQGNPYACEYSSEKQPSFIVSNPFDEGFIYPYYMTGDLLRKTIEKLFNYKIIETQDRVKDVFAMRLHDRLYTNEYDLRVGRLPLTLLFKQPEFVKENPDYPGVEVWDKPALWQKKHPDIVRRAFTEAMVRYGTMYAQDEGADKDGNVKNIFGTSFATPNAAGMLAAMRAKYPQLTEFDIVAASLMAAKPVYPVKDTDGNVKKFITYRDNGRGLMHDNYKAGFGFLSAEALEKQVGELADLLKLNPELATQRRYVTVPRAIFKLSMPSYRVTAEGFSFTLPSKLPSIIHFNPHHEETLEIYVPDDVVTLRANLSLQFEGGASAAPRKITLINPAGGEVEIIPSAHRWSDENTLSLATTDGHFGNYTKGTWKIRVSQSSRLMNAQLSFVGMNKGGLVDTALHLRTVEKPLAQVKVTPVPSAVAVVPTGP